MIRKKLLFCLLYLSLFKLDVMGQGRLIWSINDNWKYLPNGADFAQSPKANDEKWATVNLPHTWNKKDPFDNDETYRRGISWYRKKIDLDDRFKNKQIYLQFEGVGQVADVYVNGVFIGQHKGGYTGFTFDITQAAKTGDNLIAIRVDNSQNNFLPPLSIGYASYGGIYRDVWLVATKKVHFDPTDYGSDGIYITTPKVTNQSAELSIKSIIRNDASAQKNFQLVQILVDKEKHIVEKTTQNISLSTGESLQVHSNMPTIRKPHLWSPDDPYLYQFKSQIIENGAVLDEIIHPVGFRWFSFDANQGFSLNGKHLVLKGTNRHQDLKDKGDALSNEDHYRDMKMIKDMGCNFVRMAHYPQDPEVLHLADQLGLLVWEEVPVVNYMNPVPAFLQNTQNMIREMIRQNYNHPSVIIWGSMNEVLLWSDRAERIQVQEDSEYIRKVVRYAEILDSTVRAEDYTRESTMAMHMSDDYDRFKLSDIPGLASYNIYSGWYSGNIYDFKKEIDAKHRANPRQILFISEYGAEADDRVNTNHPKRLDFTSEYQRLFHEGYLKQMKQMPYLVGSAIWNQFDFSQPNVGGVSNNMNQKGVATWNRKPKDVYFLYKANWNPEPMIHIAANDWKTRAGMAGDTSEVVVYSNLSEVTLSLNGVSLGTQKPDDIHKCVWKISLTDGINQLIATGKSSQKIISDFVNIDNRVYLGNLKSLTFPFKEIAVNVGADVQYLDKSDHIWVEDRPYTKGSFGYIGGENCNLNIKTVKKNTDDTPLFYSYLNGVKAYRFDVPDGQYELELCFIEGDKINAGDRVFSVKVNDQHLLENVDLMSSYGYAVAVNKKFKVTATAGKGIDISFEATAGKAILSGIKLRAVN